MELQSSLLLFISLLCFGYVSAQLYLVPDPFLQARSGGGFRAYLPDSCGVENFEFEASTNDTEDVEWIGGNVTKPDGNHWIYEKPELSLSTGDSLRYRARIRHLGRMYRHPETEWIVPDLVPEFAAPPVDKRHPCGKDRKPPPKLSTKPPKEETTPPPPPTAPPQKPFKSPCPWVDIPRPGDSREVVLEKQLVGLQCEMAAFMDRSARLQFQLTQELTDLKKLNYAAVARMQRLESLIRSIPRAYPSYPFI